MVLCQRSLRSYGKHSPEIVAIVAMKNFDEATENYLQLSQPRMYADDTSITFAGSDVDEIE